MGARRAKCRSGFASWSLTRVGFLLFVVIACAIGITAVVFFNRPKTSTEFSIKEFGKGLDAVAPQDGATRGARPKPGQE